MSENGLISLVERGTILSRITEQGRRRRGEGRGRSKQGPGTMGGREMGPGGR